MRPLIIIFSTLFAFSSCIVELELDPPYIQIRNIEEYETKEVIHEVWSGGVLISEQAIFHAWLEIEFQNIGGLRAENVWADVTFYQGHREIQRISIQLPDIRSGNSFTYILDTGFESIYDYGDYNIEVYWE